MRPPGATPSARGLSPEDLHMEVVKAILCDTPTALRQRCVADAMLCLRSPRFHRGSLRKALVFPYPLRDISKSMQGAGTRLVTAVKHAAYRTPNNAAGAENRKMDLFLSPDEKSLCGRYNPKDNSCTTSGS